MTALIIGILLVVGGVAFAAAPFLTRDRTGDRTPTPDGASGGDARSVAARAPEAPATPRSEPLVSPSPFAAELEELELDWAMGKLSGDDYTKLRAAIERRVPSPVADAPSTRDVAQAEGVAQGAGVAQAEDLAQAEGVAQADVGELAERLVREERRHVVTCATCGPRPEPAARFCSRCGATLGGCPSCGHQVGVPGARFCDHCGAALASR